MEYHKFTINLEKVSNEIEPTGSDFLKVLDKILLIRKDLTRRKELTSQKKGSICYSCTSVSLDIYII